MSEAGSILAFQADIAKKREYQPPANIQQYIAAQMAEYILDYQGWQKQYKFFNGRNFLGYMTLAKEDTFKYVPPPQDPNDWRNFVRSGEERNKLDGLLSFLFDLNFRAEPQGRSWTGEISSEIGEVGEGYLRFLNIIDETDVKDPLTDLAMFSVGTMFKQIKFTTRNGIRKIAPQWNPSKSILDYKFSTSSVVEFEGIESTLWKPNRVMVSDITNPLMSKQDHIWYEAVIPYAYAYKTFGQWDQWQFVKPYSPNYDQWTDSEIDTETEDDQRNDKVRVRFRESVVTNELSIYCNRVLMTPPGLELPDGELSMIGQQAGYLDPNFFYGRSFMDNVRGWVAVKDVLMSTGVDISRQILEPPLKSRFRTMVNRYMLAPRSVTPMQGDGDLTPILPESASRNFALEMMKQIDDQVNRSSISPVFQGQANTKGSMTKYEVQQELIQSIRNIAGMVGAAAQWRKQEAEKKLRLGIRHLAKITGFKFDVPGSHGMGGKSIEFGEVTSSSKKYAQIVRKMIDTQNISKANGDRKKMYYMDSEKIKDYSWIVEFRVNPQSRDSDASDEKEMVDKVGLLRSGPTIDQGAVDKYLVRGLGEDEDEFIQKQQVAAPPIIPGQMGQSPQPSMSQFNPQPQAENTQAEMAPDFQI